MQCVILTNTLFAFIKDILEKNGKMCGLMGNSAAVLIA